MPAGDGVKVEFPNWILPYFIRYGHVVYQKKEEKKLRRLVKKLFDLVKALKSYGKKSAEKLPKKSDTFFQLFFKVLQFFF